MYHSGCYSAHIAQNEQGEQGEQGEHMKDENEMLSSTEACARLGVSASTIKRMADRGDLPAVKVGNRYKFKASDLAVYLEAARVSPLRAQE